MKEGLGISIDQFNKVKNERDGLLKELELINKKIAD
jgi:SMC interacting uncharacterized protein involved in chromosome segregation